MKQANETDFKEIEKKWQKRWDDEGIGYVERDESKKKFFIIWAYATVSGFQHTGHMRGYSYADAISRYKRMTGHNVLLCAGGHATGNGAIAKAQKIKEKDAVWIKDLKDRGLTQKEIEKLGTDKGFIDYFSKEFIKDYKRFGFLGDWRRFMITTTPDYNKFIEWQFRKLKGLGYIIQKPYYANCCVKDGPVAVDPSEMDLSKGGNAEQQEYTLLKLQFGNKKNQYIVAATLRPETLFGQTNIWVDYNGEYAKVQLKPNNRKEEIWIVSKEFAEKIKYQMDDVKIVGTIKGKELTEKYCKAPFIKRDIIILPSEFCDPSIGTGIVTSVPSDAPADYIGLKDLQDSKEICEKYGLDNSKIKNIELIPIIKTSGFGKYPAREICEKYGIKTQKDAEKLEQAKKEVYKKGYHTGVMMENAGRFSGLKVSEAKEKMKQELIKTGEGDIFFDLSEEVVCRCGNPVYVMKRENAWFIKYSDENWTKKSINHAKKMNLYPATMKGTFANALEWFSDRACAREGRWLGTRFPFDENYVIEAISDSTLYPIYYTVSHYVNQNMLKAEQLTEEFFDYVFLGEGSLKTVSKRTGVDEKLLERIKKDVDYWYPLDLNLGGKEHVTVHFPPFLMNHVAILEKSKWPKGIFINYWVMQNPDEKLSKSKGGAQPIPGVSEKYTVDGMRLYYANAANPFVDIYFDEQELLSYRTKIQGIHNQIKRLIETELSEEKHQLDEWFESSFNSNLKNVSEAMNENDFKTASNGIYITASKIFNKYASKEGKNKIIITAYLEKWIRMMGIFTPHIAEELYEIYQKKNGLEPKLVSTSMWPEVEQKKIKKEVEESVEYIESIKKDIRDILTLIKKKNPEKITLVVSSKWKYEFFRIVKELIETTQNPGDILSKIMKTPLKQHGKDISRLVPRLVMDRSKIPLLNLSQKKERKLLNSFKTDVEQEFSAKIAIETAENSKKGKANSAMPMKPAIIIE